VINFTFQSKRERTRMNANLKNLIEPDDIRTLQMKIVERAVRPVRAIKVRKRKFRDELLAHLSAIYDEELSRWNDPQRALEEASNRFGDSAELTAELQTAVPRIEQWEAALEPLCGWRPPESEILWMCRVTIHISLLMTITYLLVALFAVQQFGWSYSVWLMLRPLAACVIVSGIIIALSGICYFKIRDSIFGTFGSPKSWASATTWATLLTASTVACGLTFKAVAYGSLSSAAAVFFPWLAACMIWSASVLVFARIVGPQEIRDAQWALLDLDERQFAD
jgi:hypothetical protein